MANALYDTGRAAFLTGAIDWATDNIKAILVDTTKYTVNLATDQYLSIIPSGAIVATSPNMTSPTTTAGVAGVANYAFSAVTGAQCQAIVYYKDTGTTTTSQLICYIDTATGLPVTPNGGDINIQIDTGANKLFKL